MIHQNATIRRRHPNVFTDEFLIQEGLHLGSTHFRTGILIEGAFDLRVNVKGAILLLNEPIETLTTLRGIMDGVGLIEGGRLDLLFFFRILKGCLFSIDVKAIHAL